MCIWDIGNRILFLLLWLVVVSRCFWRRVAGFSCCWLCRTVDSQIIARNEFKCIGRCCSNGKACDPYC